MTDPRDFLPAKYNKTQKDKSVFPPTDLKAENQSSKIDSPWADLAKEPKIPTYRSAVANSNNNNNDQVSDEKNPTTGFSDKFLKTANQTSTFTPKRKSNSKLAGLLVVFFLIIGVFSSYLLTQQNQDGRQQASGGSGCDPGTPYCNDDGTCADGYGGALKTGECSLLRTPTATPTRTVGSKVVYSYLPPTPTLTPRASGRTLADDLIITPLNGAVNTTTGLFGECVGAACSSSDLLANLKNPKVLIRGTYPCANDSGRCLVGGSGAAATSKAAIEYGFNVAIALANTGSVDQNDAKSLINNGLLNIINHNDYTGNGTSWDFSAAQLIPYVPCSEGGNPDCKGKGFKLIPTNGEPEIDQLFTYLETYDDYVKRLDKGETWVPTGVGGVNYPHFTTCTDQGSGVDLIGCGVELPKDGGDGDNTPKPPSTTTIPPSTTTIPPTVTAAPPICSNIEMLDSTGNIMTADDDEKLRNGDQVKFRASAANASSSVITYEFRLMAPNTTAWQNITNTSAGAAAANVSAAYAIISSGHHIVQARICFSGGCQAWENVDTSSVTSLSATTTVSPSETASVSSSVSPTAVMTVAATTSPSTTGSNWGAVCTPACSTGQECYLSATSLNGSQVIVPTCRTITTAPTISAAPTTTGGNCSTAADCSSTETCYQPPMPTCPVGVNCIQVLPAKYCTAN